MNRPKNRNHRLTDINLKARYKKFGFTSLETLSAWNLTINKIDNSNFTCHKQHTLVPMDGD